VVLVVLVDEILDDGPGLPQHEACVRVLDGGHAAVGVELEERLPLYVLELEDFEIEGDVQLFEYHAYFDGIGADGVSPDSDGLKGAVG
jgi:hypothetical protein